MEIKPNIFYCGVQNPELRVFDIIMSTPFGTSYNAYLIKGEKYAALLENVKDSYWEEYKAKVNEIMPIEKIKYLIVNHTEPDHAGTIDALLDINPDITIVGTSSALQFLSYIVNKPFNKKVVKKGDSIDLGNRELQFYPMPNLHWPDTMFTLDVQENALFSCDCFGAHFSYEPVLLSTMEDKSEYFKAQRDYFADILSPFTHPFVVNGTEFAKEIKPEIIFTGHGPVLDSNIDEILESYTSWCKQPEKNKKQVAIAFVSAYGYTKTLAETVYNRLLEKENISVSLFEATEDSKTEIVNAILNSDAFLLGTPTILGDALAPIAEITYAVHPAMLKGKIASAFGSYGWSGEGVPNIMARFEQLKVKTVEGLRVRFKPSEEDIKKAIEFADRVAEAIQ
ncbi:MAG: FprA family A-type flavoprotein [Eubacteriales bacterium]|nr:FprA family A-type flavoprotein [Eubacteriales bacterium]